MLVAMLPRLAALGLALCLPLAAAPQRDAPADVEWRVRVVDPSGRPLANVAVFAETAQDPAGAADATTNAAGRATWRAPASASARFSAPDRIPLIFRSASSTEWNGIIEVGRIVLHRGVPLVGIVRGPDKQGIEGVWVRLGPAAKSQHAQPSLRPHLVARSDGSGVFKLPAVPDGAFHLSLAHDDYLAQTVRCITPRSPLDITLDPGERITGRAVVAEGEVPRFWCEARTEVGRSYGKTEEDGRFAIRVPTGVRYRLMFQGGATRAGQLVGPIATGPQDGIEWSVPVAEALPRVEVRCRSAAGKPVAEFSVAARWSQDHAPPYSSMCLWFRGVAADDRGVAALDVDREWQPNRGVLRVRAPGYGETFVPIHAPADGEPPEPIEVTLQPEVVVHGRVLRADSSEPLAGAKVWAMPNGLGQIGYGAVPDVAVTTDAEGRYRLAGLAPGTWTLEAHKPGWFRPFAKQVELDPATAPVLAADDIALTPPETVTVQIVGLEDPERWFVHQGLSPAGDGMNFMPGHSTRVRHASTLVDPSPWTCGGGKVVVSVQTFSSGTSPYPIRRAAEWEQGNDGVARIRVRDGRVYQVSGRWLTDDYAFVERLGVQALPTSIEATEGWSEVRADGSWSLDVAPGSYRIAVVDFATGLALWRSAPIVVSSHVEDVEVHPQFEPVALRFQLADPARPLPIGSLSLEGHRFSADLRTLLLPPRPVTIRYRRTPPGRLGTTGPYMAEGDWIEATWRPGSATQGSAEWRIEAPAPLSPEELLSPGSGR